jgi:hypothetical protein
VLLCLKRSFFRWLPGKYKQIISSQERNRSHVRQGHQH